MMSSSLSCRFGVGRAALKRRRRHSEAPRRRRRVIREEKGRIHKLLVFRRSGEPFYRGETTVPPTERYRLKKISTPRSKQRPKSPFFEYR